MLVNSMIWLARLLFVAVLLMTMITLLTSDLEFLIGKGPTASDKANHVIVFYALMVVAVTAFPAWRTWVIGLVLMMFGVGIEIAQSFVGREFGVIDALANGLGVLLVLLPLYVAEMRRLLPRGADQKE